MDWLLLAALPVVSLLVALGPLAILEARVLRSGMTSALWVLSVALLCVWVAVEYRAGVRADETGTGGTILDASEMAWWYAAVVVGAAAIAGAFRTRRLDKVSG